VKRVKGMKGRKSGGMKGRNPSCLIPFILLIFFTLLIPLTLPT
jgi:hypothetical protein